LWIHNAVIDLLVGLALVGVAAGLAVYARRQRLADGAFALALFILMLASYLLAGIVLSGGALSGHTLLRIAQGLFLVLAGITLVMFAAQFVRQRWGASLRRMASRLAWRAHLRFRSSEQSAVWAAAVERMADALLALDTQDRIIDMNASMQAIVGVAQERARGQPLAALAPAVHAALLAARQAPAQVTDAVLEVAEVQSSYAAHVSPLVSNDSKMRGHLLLLHDNHARLQVEEALRASEAQLRAIIDHSPLAIILFDTTGNILLWNVAAERLYGWTAEEVLGKPLPTVPDEQLAEKQAFQARVNGGEVITYAQVERRRRDGAIVYIALSVAPLKDAAGRVYAQMSITTDITELKRTQADLLHREQALIALQERERIGRELHDGLGQMLGYLNVQVQATQVMVANGLTLAAQANLQQMAQVAQDTHANLRNHILGLRTPLLTQEGMFQALKVLLTQFSEASGIVTTLRAPGDVAASPFLPAVEEQILRIIQEALANVRKHASAHQVEVTFTFTREQVQVVIADDGVGFEPAHIAALYAGAPHFGLAIMSERAEQIGGRLEVHSAPGKGAQIRLFVPCATTGSAPESDDVAVLQRIRVLLVDDQPLFLDGLRNLLRAHGITVVGTARDGIEAHAQARALLPDVIVMDVEMPRCDGVEATRRIKAELPDIKVVMLTVSDAEDKLFAALRSGASGYLLKNLDANEFCQLLAGVMRGEAPLAPVMAGRVLDEFAQRPPLSANTIDPALTPHQSKILTLVAQGKLYKEVAAELNLSEKTIKYHMGQILDRLHLESREQAIAYARRRQPG
jgi:PAS domain S-box-containing protein